jgi:hypothetical protein
VVEVLVGLKELVMMEVPGEALLGMELEGKVLMVKVMMEVQEVLLVLLIHNVEVVVPEKQVSQIKVPQ